MADNILKATLVVTAPGVQQTFNSVASGVSKAEQSLKRISPASNQATNSLTNLGRVVQDAPFGFIGIANNINPLLESFQRLKAESGSTGGALGALKGALLGPAGLGIAVSAISSLLIVFGDKLFATTKSFSDAEISAAKFSSVIRKTKDDVDNLKSSLDFQNSLQKVSLQLSGLSGAGLSSAGRGVDISQNTQFITELTGKINALTQANKRLISDRVEVEKAFISLTGGKTTTLGGAVKKLGGDLSALNDDIIKKLSDSDKALVSKYRQTSQTITDLTKQRADAVRAVLINAASLPVDFVKPIKTSELRIAPDKVTVEPTLSKINLLQVPVKDFSVDTSGLKLQNSTFLKEFKDRNEAQLEPIRAQLLELAKLGEFVGNKLADGFINIFSAIGQGESPIRALGEAVKQLVTQLIAAAIRAFIVRAIINLFAPGAGAIAGTGALSGILEGFGGFRAAGGPVQSGRGYIVGENGPEFFQPGVSGSIIPNNRLNTFNGGGFGNNFAGQVRFVIGGNELIGVMASANKSQSRLGG
jgi:hypothetical protein